MKRIAWLDTLRVLASVLVIISHYSYLIGGDPTIPHFLTRYVFNVGTIGVILFFAVSGYLAANSLERTPSIKEFYRRKAIRILVPYVAAYVVAFVILQFLEQLPEPHAGILLSILPVDINLIVYFELQNYHLTGEWFIGVIIYLYALAPLLYSAMKKNFALTMALSILIALLPNGAMVDLQDNGKLFSSDAIFTFRVPEFLMGMAIFRYKDFLEEKIRALRVSAGIIFTILAAHNLFSNPQISIWGKIFLSRDWTFIFIAISTIIIFYAAASFLNEKFPTILAPFNSLSNISYIAMLVHHTIIFQLGFFFPPQNKFQAIILFGVVIILTIIFSAGIRKIYKPIEEKLVRG